MKRGTIALFGAGRARRCSPTFEPSGTFRPHVLTIYLRQAPGAGASPSRRPLSPGRSGGTMGTGSRGAGARSWSPRESSMIAVDARGRAMDLNARALRLVDALLADARRAEGRPSTRSRAAAGTSTAGSRPGAACSPGSTWRGSAWPTWPRSRSSRATSAGRPCPVVQVTTDHPVAACLGSQYAGWAISEGKFFAMGSGPMRAAYGHEPIFEEIGLAETARRRRRRPGRRGSRRRPAVFAKIAEACRVAPSAVTLLIAPTASLAGRRAGRRAVGRDGPAQAPRAEVRPPPDRLGARRRPRCRRSRRTTSPRSAGPTTRSSTGPGSSST